MKKNKIVLFGWIAVFLVIAFFFLNTKETKSPSIREDSLVIVTSFYPMYLHTTALTKGVPVEVVNLASQQVGCLHDYQLSVEDMKKVARATVLVTNGLGAEGFMERAFEQNPDLRIINASEVIEEKLEEEEHKHEEDTYEEVIREEESSIGHEGHNHLFNEHVWVSVAGSIEQVKAISKGLQEADKVHAARYAANEKVYIEALMALKEEMHTTLAPLKGKEIVTTHTSFWYLAEELGIEVVKVILEEEETLPTARQIEGIIEVMDQKDIHLIFSEQQYENVGLVKTIATESKSNIIYLDSIVSPYTQQEEAKWEYIERMENNLNGLKEAYGL